MEWKKFWMGIKSAMKEGAHKFSLWLQLSVKPELMEFLDKNKDLANKIVMEVAQDLMDSDG